MKKSIVFDADDTLWDEQAMLQGFEKAVETILDKELGYPSEFSKTFIDLENKNIPHIGYGFPSYMFSVGEAITANPDWYVHKDKLLDRIKEIIGEFTLRGPKLIDGVVQTLDNLSDLGYDLHVLTRGVEFEQKFKLDKSGIKDYFSSISIVPVKNTPAYVTASKYFNKEAGNLCMVGNSIKADVNPAVEAGWRAIHVPAPTAWAHDEAILIENIRAHSVSKMTEVVSLVQHPTFWG